MALGYLETKTLQALRAGPMESWQLLDRLGSSSGLSKLITLGYVKHVEGIYSITQSGKDNCPTRRSTETFSAASIKEIKTASEIDIPVFINAGLPIEKGPSMEINQSSVADALKATDQPKNDTPSAPVVASDTPDYSDKPKAYQMLKYIEANPGCTNRQIMLALGMDPYIAINAYIKPYIDFVRIDHPVEGPRVFTLTIPVDSFYVDKRKAVPKQLGAKNENASTPQPKQETNDDIGRLSQSLATSVTKADPVEQVQKSPDEIHQTKIEHDRPAAKVRFAITSDKHIILMGLFAEDIELTEADSHTLIKFCGDIALAANASDALANRMVDLETLGS